MYEFNRIPVSPKSTRRLITVRKIQNVLLFVLILSVALTGLSFVSFADESLGRLQPVRLSVTCEDFQRDNHISESVKIAVHGRLEITLCSNPSTGYSWSDSARISNHSVLWQTNHTAHPSSSSAIGSAGRERWTFRGLQEGTTTISLRYSRGGMRGPDDWTFEVKVEVVDDSDSKSDDSTDKDEIGEKLVRGIFKDIHDSNISSLSSKLSENFQVVRSSGATDRKGEIEILKGIDLEEYTLDNFKVTRQDQTLIVTYTVKADETIQGETVPKEPVPRLSIFIKTDSGWKWLAHANLS